MQVKAKLSFCLSITACRRSDVEHHTLVNSEVDRNEWLALLCGHFTSGEKLLFVVDSRFVGLRMKTEGLSKEVTQRNPLFPENRTVQWPEISRKVGT
jgi:hypothetical protein